MTWQRCYFDLSSGLKKSIVVPAGTCEAIKKHVEEVTDKLKLEVLQYGENPPHWNQYTPSKDVDNYKAGKVVADHNMFVIELYEDLAKWSRTPPEGDTEELTPEFASTVWYGLSRLYLNYDRWSPDYYKDQMSTLFGAMTTGESYGASFGEEPLSMDQAAAVIELFSGYIDTHNVNLVLPNGYDYLISAEDCYYCPQHGWWEYCEVEESNEDGEFVCPAAGCEEVM